MAPRCISPAKGPLRGEIRAPSSKSATHRALVAAALADGSSELLSPLDADDTRRTRDGLRALGVSVTEGVNRSWTIVGTGGTFAGGGRIALGASGTSARFLTAFAALGSEPSTLDGSPRLRERPMNEIVDALSALGAHIRASEGATLPIRAGGRPVTGGSLTVPGDRSSQFASALILAAPAFRSGLTLTVPAPRVSFPYVLMTIEVLEAFGARIERVGDDVIAVPPQRLRAATVEIEGDHSSVSYALAATAILGGRLRVSHLRRESTQADARFLRDLAGLGCTVRDDGDRAVVVESGGTVPPFDWNLADAPDLAPTAAILGLFSQGPCRLTGLSHLRLKESDRLEALRSNLSRMGARVAVDGETLSIDPPGRKALHGASIDVAADHRIAMAFAIAGLAVPGVAIDDPDSVAKSYPAFWQDLDALTRTGSSTRG